MVSEPGRHRGAAEHGSQCLLSWGRGIDAPEQGCIAVFSFQGLGHVGFFISEEGKSVNILGGNQSDVVKVSRYATKDVVGYRMPASADASAAAVEP